MFIIIINIIIIMIMTGRITVNHRVKSNFYSREGQIFPEFWGVDPRGRVLMFFL